MKNADMSIPFCFTLFNLKFPGEIVTPFNFIPHGREGVENMEYVMWRRVNW